MDQRLGPYRLVRLLGAGGMGVVHEAVDEARSVRVAVKTLPRLSPKALYQFKREFRGVADVVHPNLVRLFELGAEGDTWFFAMELVEGVDFLTYVRQGAPAGEALGPEAEVRLRASLRQLAAGVAALHAAGLLHLDLKPANVLVEHGGRVVVLDFGLARPATPGVGEGGRELCGTPYYLSPEQVSGSPPSGASDWYAVGLMLFEALTGAQPFGGSIWESLLARTRGPPPNASSVRPGVPEDLDWLCRWLLDPEPSARPSEAEVLERLGARPAVAAPEVAARPPLVGRRAELERLLAAYRGVAPGEPAMVTLRGPSGIGKSALASGFLERVRELDRPLALAARCYERESVPYKAFDPVIDALARHIQGHAVEEQRALFDEDAHHAARIFPLLRGCKGLSGVPQPPEGELDPLSARRRGFLALKRVLWRLGAERRIVIFIDDLQWGDADSARLLEELLSGADAPPLLLLGAYRADEAAQSAFFQVLREDAAAQGAARPALEIELGPLPLEEAIALSEACLGGPDPERARQIAVESGGSPFFIEELSRHAARPGAGDAPPLSLDEMIDARLAELPRGCERVLRVLSVAGRPLQQDLAGRAAHVEPEDPQAAVAFLRAAHLVRTRGPRGDDLMETYHDRIRDAAMARLDAAERRRLHGELARALEASPWAEPEHLAQHLHGAGEDARAAGYAAQAAERAEAALAFDRAAELYGDALAWGAPEPVRRRDLLARRGRALVNAGRTAAAAPLFLEAAEGEGERARRELLRQAAEAFLVAGHIDEGLAALRPLLGEVGLSYPSSSARAGLSIAAQLVEIWLRGVACTPQPAQELELVRADLCWSLGKGLFSVLPSQGTAFIVRSLRCALKAGEPARVSRSLASVSAVLMMQGGRPGRLGESYLARAEALARELGDPYLQANVLLSLAYGHLFAGRWRAMLDHAERALAFLEVRCTGVRWECVVAAGFVLLGLGALGEMGEVERRSEQHVREAIERGDLYAQVMFTQHASFARIARGDTEGARRGARWALERWIQDGYTVQHLYSMRIEAYCDLYEGSTGAALARVRADWPSIRRSLVIHVPMSRVDSLLLLAHVELAQAEARGGRALLRSCEAVARQLEREPMRLEGRPHAALIRAGIAACHGERDRALALLDECIAGYDVLELGLYAACARRRRGELAGDAAEVAGAEAWMRGRGIADPERWARVLAPGFGAAGQRLRAA